MKKENEVTEIAREKALEEIRRREQKQYALWVTSRPSSFAARGHHKRLHDLMSLSMAIRRGAMKNRNIAQIFGKGYRIK